jgi:FkbM family methyltransferase
MLTALHRLLKVNPSNTHILDLVLPKLTKELQGDFCHWVDGGSGVGGTSWEYSLVLAAQLADPRQARVYCYDPLPDNYQAMKTRLGDNRHPFVLREAALSSDKGEATFVVPSRVGTGAGMWAPGTSWDGYLKRGPTSASAITVKTVRLQDEDIPRFDFVKLDLQGGELGALQGMGDRLAEAKLLYVETQLLPNAQNPVPYLKQNGFLPFYDRLQFGVVPGTKFLPLGELKECGIVVDRIHLPQTAGMPFICWGYFDSEKGALDPETSILKQDIADRLVKAGISYIQTDALAVNPAYWGKVEALLAS